jgi:hypothetical protein
VFHDARLVPPGNVEVTPAIAGLGFSGDGESEYLANAFGVQALVGVHERVNIGGGYVRFEEREFRGGVNAVGGGVKLALKKDRIALGIPVSALFGEGVDVNETWQLHPIVFFTVPIGPRFDFNPSARVLIPFCDDCERDVLLGFNAGFGWRPFAQPITLRPEAGILVNPGETGVLWTFGVGVSFRSDR